MANTLEFGVIEGTCYPFVWTQKMHLLWRGLLTAQ
jgi:hypothetical protein